MIQLGQLSLFVMAQLASRLPLQTAHVPLHWTYQLDSFSERKGEEWKADVAEGKKCNKEGSNNHIIHLNVDANYRDKCDSCSVVDVWSENQGGLQSDVIHGDLTTEVKVKR